MNVTPGAAPAEAPWSVHGLHAAAEAEAEGAVLFPQDHIFCPVLADPKEARSFVSFLRGTFRSLDDPSGLFNASLDAGTRRAIDLRENDELDEAAFRELVREAVAHNRT